MGHIDGVRPGTKVLTDGAGVHTAGQTPSGKQEEQLKDMGFELKEGEVKAGPDVEAQPGSRKYAQFVANGEKTVDSELEQLGHQSSHLQLEAEKGGDNHSASVPPGMAGPVDQQNYDYYRSDPGKVNTKGVRGVVKNRAIDVEDDGKVTPSGDVTPSGKSKFYQPADKAKEEEKNKVDEAK